MIKVLVQKKHGQAHKEVLVDINWDDVSAEDIKFLAQQLLIHNLQAKIKAGFYDEIPEIITIRAEWEVHRDCVGMKDYKIPDSWRSGEDKPKVVVEKLSKLEQMLAALSPEDREKLLA